MHHAAGGPFRQRSLCRRLRLPNHPDIPLRIVRVALPLPIDTLFSYRVEPRDQDRIGVGSRVKVPFGRRTVTGVAVAEGRPEDAGKYELKAVKEVMPGAATLTDELLDLTKWISEYYLCAWGEALRAALPPGSVGKPGGSAGPRLVTRVRLHPQPPQDEPRGSRQQKILETLRRWTAAGRPAPTQPELLDAAGGDSTTVRRLEELGYVVTDDDRVDRSRRVFGDDEPAEAPAVTLHEAQRQATDRIAGALEEGSFHTFLLHGVTGSGKTEVYLAALERARSRGRSGIVLVPEIAPTPQTVRRFRRRFGDEIAVLHSRMSQGERYDAWTGIRTGRYPIVIGPRSAVLAPVENPGLIIVDEEHEPSYKQFDPAPRYHARDVAVMRALKNDAVCILGSATPSLESLANARAGKYTLLSMPERVPVDGRPAALPKVRVVDLRGRKADVDFGETLSAQLLEALDERRRKSELSILLLNRRGYAPVLECTECGHVPECSECTVSLVYHKSKRHLRCHYCGLTERLPNACLECGEGQLEQLGAGTQRLEEELGRRLPDARVLRMDLDTTSAKYAHHEILGRFGRGEADILLGTQMVAKGLDFDRVTLVGIVHADAGLHLPDIRAEERAFQLLTQVAGRAGRAELAGEVYLQTRQPGHEVIQHAIRHDYAGFAEKALEARKELGYPPVGRMISVIFSGPEDGQAQRLAEQWTNLARTKLPALDFLGPSPAFIHRVKRAYRHQAIVKLPSRFPQSEVRRSFAAIEKKLSMSREYRINVDVDPAAII